MLEMETFAIAARLHVVMRRAAGRVTDVDWMVRNRDYAREVIRLARLHADVELLALADKFEASLVQARAPEAALHRVATPAAVQARGRAEPPATHVMPAVPRYVGRLR